MLHLGLVDLVEGVLVDAVLRLTGHRWCCETCDRLTHELLVALLEHTPGDDPVGEVIGDVVLRRVSCERSRTNRVRPANGPPIR